MKVEEVAGHMTNERTVVTNLSDSQQHGASCWLDSEKLIAAKNFAADLLCSDLRRLGARYLGEREDSVFCIARDTRHGDRVRHLWRRHTQLGSALRVDLGGRPVEGWPAKQTARA